MKQKYRKIDSKLERAVLGGGCFWCLETVFSRLRGVKSVSSGYAGGKKKNPTYEDVCLGKTGHAEVVRIEFDPKVISFKKLLSIFFSMHDPTTPNRQGADSGTQYRSIILYSDEIQKNISEKFIQKLNQEKIFSAPIVTEISPFKKFYPAEKYHQKYFENNILKPYCQIVISPKVNKMREKFGDMLK